MLPPVHAEHRASKFLFKEYENHFFLKKKLKSCFHSAFYISINARVAHMLLNRLFPYGSRKNREWLTEAIFQEYYNNEICYIQMKTCLV